MKQKPAALPDRFSAFAIRDGLLLIITLGLWWYSPLAQGWQIFTGIMTGLCALLFHEWGHLYGAHRSGATVRPAPSLFLPFLFDLDSKRNSPDQFLTTSVWGFYATGLFLLFFIVALPGDSLASTTTWWIAGGLSMLTVIIEFPIAWRVYRGHPIPGVEIYRRP
ncbi:MAG: hypothetical protein AAF541_12825 [Pseudomonadota bacterium]